MRPIDEIVVHCTATRPEWLSRATVEQKVSEVRRWHMQDRGWKDIGYHWLIDRDGSIAAGRPLEQVGAHVAGHNTGTIGIALFGGHGSAETDAFEDNFTPQQDAALRILILEMRNRFPGIKTVSGHNWYAAKACPGFDVSVWYQKEPIPQTAPKPEPAPAPQGWFAALLALFFGGKK